MALSHSLDCHEDRLNTSRRHTCLYRGRIPHQAQISGPLYWRNCTVLVHFSLRLALTPILSCERERHLDAKLLTALIELESINRPLHFTSSYALYNYYVTNKETLNVIQYADALDSQGSQNCIHTLRESAG